MTCIGRAAASVLLAALAQFAALPAARGEEASPWTQGFHSRARLLSGGVEGGRLRAGIEIELDRGFKTYWRNPGESGLPPRFDWSASTNAGEIELRWPAPSRSEDAGGVAYGYLGRVVFPVLVTPREPGRPVGLSVTVEYGVCKDICIPASARMSLALAGEDAGKAIVDEAFRKVPRRQSPGADAPLSILSVEPVPGDRPALAVTVRASPATRPALFAEGPENWYLSTPADMDWRSGERGRFLASVEERPKGATGPVAFLFTLVAGDEAVESEVHLDAGLEPR